MCQRFEFVAILGYYFCTIIHFCIIIAFMFLVTRNFFFFLLILILKLRRISIFLQEANNELNEWYNYTYTMHFKLHTWYFVDDWMIYPYVSSSIRSLTIFRLALYYYYNFMLKYVNNIIYEALYYYMSLVTQLI